MSGEIRDKDPFLDTGRYKPKRYWEERAKTSKGDTYDAVCVFGLSKEENAAAEKVQADTLKSVLHTIKLKDAKVMEFGCGVGRWANYFLGQGASYIGVDISEGMLEMARERVPRAELHRIDSSELPLPENEIDLAFSITVLHHNSHKDQRAIIDEMVRVTKPGGFILLMEGVEEKRDQSSFNMFPRTIDGWVAEVEKSGACLVKIKPIDWWLLRSAVFKLLRSLGMQKANSDSMKTLNSILVRTGLYMDKYLLVFLPRRFASNAAMLFKKVE